MTQSPDQPERPLDLRELLETLARHGVDYVVIGGVAVQVHGHRRTTKDLDVVPAPAADNYARLSAALAELEAAPVGMEGATVEISPGDPERLAQAPIAPPLATRHGVLHIVNDPAGGAPYAELRSRALTVDLGGVDIAIAALDDLIQMKRATGRPEDARDIAALTPTPEPPTEPKE